MQCHVHCHVMCNVMCIIATTSRVRAFPSAQKTSGGRHARKARGSSASTRFDAMEDGGFASFPKFESAPAAPPAAEQPQAVPAAQRPQTAPAAEQKVRVVGIKDAGEKKAAPAAAAAGGSVSSSWGGWGGGWLSSAASAMPQSTAALEGMTSMMSVTSMRASANAAAERLSAAMPVTAAAMDAMSPIAAASSLREKVSAALTVPLCRDRAP